MERLILEPIMILLASAFLLGSYVVVSELFHALGLGLAANHRRFRVWQLPLSRSGGPGRPAARA